MKISIVIFIIIFYTYSCNNQKQTEKPISDRIHVENHYSIEYPDKDSIKFFSDKLKEQEEQLKLNPQVIRFKDSRLKQIYNQQQPIYHFTSPENQLNDPNGICFWQGRWHLFYQGSTIEDKRTHWGHAISKDLIHWRDLPFAIKPGPEPASYSGNTLVGNDRVIAMYHGVNFGNMIAISDDPLLLNWEKLTGKAVIPKKSTSGFPLPYDVLDPCIWKEDSIYYSISNGRRLDGPGGKQVRANWLFRSKDLVNWQFMHDFVEQDHFTKVWDDGACPNFLPIGDRYILLFFSHYTGAQYFLGDYDKKRNKFIVTSHGNFNHGLVTPSGIHAPSATSDGKGGVIAIFNMNQGKPTEKTDRNYFSEGVMTLPMRLTLIENDKIGIEPAGSFESLRLNYENVNNIPLPANEEVILKNINGNAMEFKVEIDPKNASMIEMNVLRSPNKEEYTRIVFYKSPKKNNGFVSRPMYWNKYPELRYDFLSIETSFSSLLPDVLSRPPEVAPLYLSEDENLKLHVFIDKSMVEVFANGIQYLAVRVYPSLKESLGVSLQSRGQDSKLISLKAWQMKSIYEQKALIN